SGIGGSFSAVMSLVLFMLARGFEYACVFRQISFAWRLEQTPCRFERRNQDPPGSSVLPTWSKRRAEGRAVTVLTVQCSQTDSPIGSGVSFVHSQVRRGPTQWIGGGV